VKTNNGKARRAHLSAVTTARPLETVRLDDGRFVMQQLRAGAPGGQRIICFPFAGGGPLAFRALVDRLPSSYEVWAVDFPGHVRTRGEALRSVEALALQCLRVMPVEMLTTSYFVGYSLGGYVAHALAAALERHGYAVPGVILAASTPPSVRALSAPLSDLDRDGLFEWLVGLGQADGSEQSRELYETFEDAIRADFEAYDGYWPMTRISAPTLVLAGEDDELCTPEQQEEWGALTHGLDIEVVPGNHFFMAAAPQAMADALSRFIDRLELDVTGEVRTVSGVTELAGIEDEDIALIA
jgi:surfactin synthase thioesterase subunit